MKVLKLFFRQKAIFFITMSVMLLHFVKQPASSNEIIGMKPDITVVSGEYAEREVTGKTGTGKKPPEINAAAAVVIEESTGRVLYSKNATQKRSIASITKIMTALVALENGDPDDIVTVSKRAAAIGGSTVGLAAREKYTLKELLYAMLMVSANDAAIAIAEHIGGSVEGFAEMMNRRAKTIGAYSSNFVTPHGLDCENQYSTAYDVALITREALKNPLIAEIVSTVKSSIPGHSLYNTNELLGNCEGVDGVKTGYTGKAGRCLVTSAKRGNMRVISVVLGSPTRTARAIATSKLLDYIFANYQMYRLQQAGEIIAQVPVYRGIKSHTGLMAENDIVVPLSKEEAELSEKRISMPDVLNAPVYAGSDAGYVEYSVNGEVLGRSLLKITENVSRKGYLDYLEDVLRSWGKLMKEGVFY